ncbi:MAG: SUMF1/EgtB/PvdO family nonheme iron enzyme, partial [Myxococcales bacterium]|nr:SUMF1/EgtB/PvdO family nonheme iron enzyme [Myxococcales bacterium]
EIAHEALIDGWGTLRRWLERAHETRAIRERLEAAAREWNRLARDDDALWNAEQLADVVLLDPESLEPEHRAFLAASRARRRRRVLTRVALLAAAPLCALLVLIGLRLQLQRDLARRVDDHVARASAFEQQAQRLRGDVERARHGAFAEFDLMEPERGEALWDEASALSRALDETLRESGKALEAALSLDSQHPVVRELLAEHYYARAELADARHDEAEARALVERSELYDRDGARARRWRAPATVTITSDPPGAAVTLAAYETDEFGRMSLAPPRALGTTPIESLEIYPGSFVLMFRARGRVEVRHALALTRGETRTIETRVPAEGEVPEGFVFIPRGRFLTGSSSDDDLRRAFFAAAPLHPVETPAYLIARHETTYAEWIEFLDELSPQERELRIPQVEGSSFNKGVNLTPAARGEWRLVLSSTSQANAASKGEDFEYTAREYMRAQDWSAFPVSGVSYEDAVAYAAWLDRVGKVPGARLCSGLEWERAGRGADARRYPHGDRLDPDDGNIDETYGKRLATMGPDEVGLHPRVQSPYGLEDMAGNVWEWTTSSRRRGEVAVRGGGFFHDRLAARLANLTILDPQLR